MSRLRMPFSPAAAGVPFDSPDPSTGCRRSLALSPDGALFASGAADSSVPPARGLTPSESLRGEDLRGRAGGSEDATTEG